MKIIKVTCESDIANPHYLVVDAFSEAESLHRRHYPEATIISMELISDRVINAWAQ